jgi:adenosine kinase
LIVSGYSSFDRVIKLQSPVGVGKTALITNSSCSKIFWGGCSVNVAVALSRLGLDVLPILRTGEDFESSGFKDFLEREGVSLAATIKVRGEVNSCSFLLQDPQGEHITTFYPGAMDEKYFAPYQDEWFSQSQAALMTVGSHKDNLEFLKKVKKHGIPLFFGMKGDSSAFPSQLLEEVFRESFIIFMNEAESDQIVELFQMETIQNVFEVGKAQVIVITLGSNGAKYISRDGATEHIPAILVENVVDTTGGGDGFISGFLFGYLNKLSFAECCTLGSLVASFVLEAEGCTTNLPTLDQLMERKQKKG